MSIRTNLESFLSRALTVLVLFTLPMSGQETILHEGTPVRLKLNRTISSATEKQGDTVDFEVLDNVKAGSAIVIPQGSTALATVTEAVPKGRMGKGGKLNVNIDSVRLPNGYKLSLRGGQEGKGGGHTGAMAGAMVGTAIVFWPAAPLFLFMHGKDITIPEGHQVAVYTNSDYKIPETGSVLSAKASALPGPALTNGDILMLQKAGLGDQVLVAKIKSAPGDYHLEPTELVKLKAAGVSDVVMAAMVEAKR